MANVRKYLQDILDAIYGEEVRGSIHDAIDAMNEESTNAEAVAISSRDSAKRNAEAASASATAAASSESAAALSETNAKASETAAKTSETNAKASETAAKTSETNAKASETAAKASETAAKTSETNAKASELLAYQYEQQCEQIRDDIGYPIDPKGTVTFANLPSVATAQIGWMYNVSDDFTTTSDFEEGAGKFYSAGSEVYVNSNHKWSVMAGPGVTGIKGEAESTYHKGQVEITKSMLGINTLDDIDTPAFTQASTRANINSGETISTIMGKIKKFFADLKTVAFTGNASDVAFDSTGTTSSATTVQTGLKEALTNSAPTASDVPYDNTTSGLSSTNVQDVINETYVKSFKGRLQYSGTDLDDIKKCGTWFIDNSVTTSNIPTNNFGNLIVYEDGRGVYIQEFVTITSPHIIYIRRFNTTIWTSWAEYRPYDGIQDSHIGQIIETTTLDTLAKVQAIYGSNTTWIQHSGYVLRGATSGVTSGSATKTGGADSVSYTPGGSNSGGSVTNTTLTSTAQIPAHTHGSKTLTGTMRFLAWKGSTAPNYDANTSGIVSVSGHNALDRTLSTGTNAGSQTNTITATHEHSSVGGTTAHGHGFTQPTFSGTAATINTLPNYKSVYIWERTA